MDAIQNAALLTDNHRTGDTMKQVIVMRTDLNMRKGKMIAQGAHAAIGFMVQDDTRVKRTTYREWLDGGMKKICVRADSEEELLSIHAEANEAGLPSFLVTDAGHTEFNGPTNTCIAIGPADDVAIDRITGHLKLL